MKSNIRNIVIGVISAVIAGLILAYVAPGGAFGKRPSITIDQNLRIPEQSKDLGQLTEIKEKSTVDADFEYRRGKVALDLGHYEESLKAFDFVVKNSTNEDLISSSYGNLGIAYSKLGDNVKSVLMYEEACKRHPTRYCHYTAFNKGINLLEEGKYKRAIEEFEECIALEPNGKMTKIILGYRNMNYESHYRIGLILHQHSGDCNGAIKHYIESIKPYDEEAFGKCYWKEDVIYNIASCFFDLGEWQGCIDYSKRILEYNKYDKGALMSICYSYHNMGEILKAREYCELAAKLGEESAMEYLNNN